MPEQIVPFSASNSQPLVVDGNPETVVNIAGVAEMVRNSTLGISAALAKLKTALAPEVFALVESEVSA